MKRASPAIFVFAPFLVLGIRLSPASVPASVADEALNATLRTEILAGMKAAQIPGVAVAMIKDGNILLLEGFGSRSLDNLEPVDGSTLFSIGSVTKSFTSASVALLVQQKKLNWDDKVQRFLPGFQLADRERAADITVRDLLSHRTGVQSDNLVFWGSKLGPSQLMARLPGLQVPWGLRAHFDYNNLMYMVAGEVIAKVSGEPWPEFVRKNLFQPLGMHSSFAQTSDLTDLVNVASAHMLSGGKVHTIPLLNLDNIAPAGAIMSNAADMTQWVRLQLGENNALVPALLSAQSLEEMHSAQIPLDRSPPYSWLIQGSALSAYGLGWMLSDYHGHLLLQHGGDTDGMASLIALVPERHFGLVILSNLGDPWFRQIVLYRMLDALFQRPAFDWMAFYHGVAQQYAQENSAATEAPTRQFTPASSPPCSYAGTYHHPLYGDALVSYDRDGLHLAVLGNTARLTHVRADTFGVELQRFNALQQQAIANVRFLIDAKGLPVTMSLPDGARFIRRPPGPSPFIKSCRQQ